VDDVEILTERNEHFVEACRRGSWEMLEPILSPSFSYLDGASGEVWEISRYIEAVRANAASSLRIDQVAIHVAGDTAVVSARALKSPITSNRYLDTYERRDGEWLCVHSSVWPLDTVLP
jgi:hypothetical protein